MTGRADRSHPDRLRWRKCQKENPSLSTPSSDSMPLWSATGRSRSPSCPFWSFLGVITKGYVQRVSPAKRALVSKQKKQPLLCNTLMLLLLSLTVIAQEKTREGGEAMPGENDLDRGLKGRVKKKGKRWCWMIRCCPRAAPSRFLYFVYFHLALHSLLHRGHTAYSSMTSLTTPTISLNHIDGSDAPASQTLTHMHAAALLPLFGLVSCAWCVDVISKALPVSQTWPIAGITQCAQLSSGQDHLSRPATLTLLFDPWVSSPHRIIRDVRAHAAMKIDRKQWKTRLCLDMGFPIFISSVWTLADVIY